MVNSALCFVFTIPERVANYTAAVNEVFKEISSTLAQVAIYKSMDRLHPALVRQIHLVMISFVKLSAHVVKYQQGRKRDKFLHTLKAGILHDDSDLEAEMTEFKRVLQQHRDVEGTVTLSEAVKTNQSLLMLTQTAEVVQKGVQSITSKADRVAQLNKIKDTLELPPSLDVNFESRTTELCTVYSKLCLPDTVQWLWTNEAYQNWMAPKGPASPSYHVLFVTGPASSGKSCVCASITKRLEGQDPKDRIYVAHHFFPKKQELSEGSNPAQLALKYMAFQIARVDPTVRTPFTKRALMWQRGTPSARSKA